MPVGSYWSEGFIRQLEGDELRHAYMVDQVRTRIALQLRALRDQADRQWSQSELGRRAGKPQNVISRIENPDYGQLTLQTLFDMASAFKLPLYVDFPEWEEWLGRMKEMTPASLQRQSFDLDRLVDATKAPPESNIAAAAAVESANRGTVQYLHDSSQEVLRRILDQPVSQDNQLLGHVHQGTKEDESTLFPLQKRA